MPQESTLYIRAVEISKDYLGPAAERFIRRQIMTHLDKQPENLSAADIKKLVDWVRLTFALLTEDSDLVEEYSDQLMALQKINTRERNAKKA